MAGVGSQQTAGQVAFGEAKDKGVADFSANNPIGAAIAGYSSSKMAQTAVNMAPYGLALAGQIGAARTLSTVTSVLGGPLGSLAMGLVGPSMQDPYGNTVAMGSGMLGAVSNQVMGMHYSIAEKAAAGVPGYAGGIYGGYALSVSPGFFGLTFTGVNAPDIHSYSPADFMNDLAAEAAYSASVEPFGGRGVNNPVSDPSAISVDSYSNATEAAQHGSGYSSYGPDGVTPTGAAPRGSTMSKTGIFGTSTTSYGGTQGAVGSTGGLGGGYGFSESEGSGGPDSSASTSGVGDSTRFGGKITKKKKMAMGDVVEQNPEVVQGVGFIDHDNNATPQEEIKDDKPLEAKEGDFIINAPAAEFMGKQDVEEMISVAVTSLQEKGVDVQIGNPEISTEDNVKLLVSKNEVYIPKVIAEEIGYDKLEKINNRGKKEVSRRQQEESQQQEKPQARQVAEGGFIGMADGGNTFTGEPKYRNPSDLIDMMAVATGVYKDSQKAVMDSRKYGIEYKPQDDDKTEDSIRHILGGGYMADSVFKKVGSLGYDVREFGAFLDDLIGVEKDKLDPLGEESRIDLNNNRYGRALRKLYPEEKEFKNKTIEIITNLSKGKKGPVVDGLSPMLSLGTNVAKQVAKQRNDSTEYQVN